MANLMGYPPGYFKPEYVQERASLSRMRVSTRLAPGLWLSQRVSCCGCLVTLVLLLCGGLFSLSLVAALVQQVVPPLIQMWGR